jgi:protein-arginine kinase activator protein McsA
MRISMQLLQQMNQQIIKLEQENARLKKELDACVESLTVFCPECETWISDFDSATMLKCPSCYTNDYLST